MSTKQINKEESDCCEPEVNDALEECYQCGTVHHAGNGCPREHLHEDLDIPSNERELSQDELDWIDRNILGIN